MLHCSTTSTGIAVSGRSTGCYLSVLALAAGILIAIVVYLRVIGSERAVERAKLLGYATHAHWRLENAMAKTPERAMELMEAVWTPAVARVREEVADMEPLRRGVREHHQRIVRARGAIEVGGVGPALDPPGLPLPLDRPRIVANGLAARRALHLLCH